MRVSGKPVILAVNLRPPIGHRAPYLVRPHFNTSSKALSWGVCHPCLLDEKMSDKGVWLAYLQLSRLRGLEI